MMDGFIKEISQVIKDLKHFNKLYLILLNKLDDIKTGKGSMFYPK